MTAPVLLAAALAATPASALDIQPQTGSQAAVQVALLPPAGMIVFCQSHSTQCRGSETKSVQFSNDLLAAMQAVNTRVNNSIRPVADARRDKWSVNVSSGDCEDYALTKRAQLIRMGVSPGAIRLATTTTRRGEPHAILVVKTSNGDYVLDNLSASVRKLGSTGYRIRSISTNNPMVWSAG